MLSYFYGEIRNGIKWPLKDDGSIDGRRLKVIK